MKECSKCKSSKLLTEFSKHKGHRDGYSTWCKVCIRAGNNLSYKRLHAKGRKLRTERQVELRSKGLKNCFRCIQDRPLSDFSKSVTHKDGLAAYCIACSREYRKTPEIKERAYKRAKLYWREKQEKWNEYYLKKRYNITVEDRKQMLVQQNGKCGICKKEMRKQVNIDHDHLTGKVRELLCNNCNFILGFANDDILLLESAIIYLQNHSS